ncbi:PDDEXK nuclease domain-containing protein [Pseudactinotalea terrae]|uniref:PDDEXK nuclease domain-containing protein n=1 Tax=Pseudactinotalea terrae TaxID=1743262 RepID=UPI00240D7191|nr:PDDEXK nuclease domain-containing protein [Pseudactinotalea terrae]
MVPQRAREADREPPARTHRHYRDELRELATEPDSELAHESLKDPFRLDFLGLGSEAHEREIEAALIEHVTDFLLELGVRVRVRRPSGPCAGGWREALQTALPTIEQIERELGGDAAG